VSHDSERGAAAVEFAILLPLLLMLVLGTIEFGRAYNAQITLTNAARDGVRVMAIGNDPAGAKTAAQNAAASVSSTIPTSDITLSTNTCSTGAQVTLTIKGPWPRVQSLKSEDLKARVDTQNLSPGRHRVNVSVELPGGLSLVRSKPTIVTVTVAKPS